MRFASAEHQGEPLAVAVEDGRAIPLRHVDELSRATLPALLAGADLDRKAALPLDELHLRPVIPNPRKVICVGLNYKAHAEEAGRDLPTYPVLFTKFATTLAGPFDDLPCPPESDAVDYEGELVVVIGAPGRRVARADAMEHVAGYAVANDVSMRDFQNKTHQWLAGKAWDASTPVGPYLVTPDEVGDPGALTLRTTVNGEVVQDASTELLIFDIPTLVSTVSEFATLEPGDLILTGTPAGVGFRREPQLLLGDGDVVTVEVEGVGKISNKVVAEEMSDFKVLIAGGGMGGLALAQGLVKAGVDCEVFERDAASVQRAGYRLSMTADGGNGLQRCLPDDLYELYLRASRRTPPRALAVVIDDQANEVSTMPHMGPPNEGERPHTAIDRRTLRQILVGHLGERVHDDVAATGFEAGGDGVTLTLSDGSTARGDVLVGADGISSAIREQRFPEANVIEAPESQTLGVFARSPMTPEIEAELPSILMDGFVIGRDGGGVMLAMGAYVARQEPSEAAAEVAPDVPLEPVADYMMLSGGLAPGAQVARPSEWTAETPAEIHAGMVEATAGWHPAIRGLVERLDESTLFGLRFRHLEPIPAWEPSRVTFLGDAIHAMLPTRGQGVNQTLRDSGNLTDALTAAARGERDTVEAIGAYETEMRDYVYPIMEASADHSRFGGGGLRRED